MSETTAAYMIGAFIGFAAGYAFALFIITGVNRDKVPRK